MRLTINMRAHIDPWFLNFLLRVDDGVEEVIDKDYPGSEIARFYSLLGDFLLDVKPTWLNRICDQQTKEDTRKIMGILNLKGILALSCIFSDRLGAGLLGACLPGNGVRMVASVGVPAQKALIRNHDPLALVANTFASPSYSRSSQSYYVNHPSLVHDYDDDYQGEVQGDDQEDKFSTTMMLLAQEITQHFSTSTNNRLCTSSNTKNQAVIQDGRVDIQSKNVGYAGNGSRNSGRIVRNQGNNVRNGFVQKNDGNAENVQRNPRTIANSGKIPTVQCYNCNEKGHYARECSKHVVPDSKYIREHMLLAKKDEAGIHLDDETNDFMLMSASGDEQLEELSASVIMMARIKPADNDSDVKLTYASDFVSEVKGRQVEHAYYAHDQKLDAFESLITNVQIEVENQRMVNKEMKRKNVLITKELETYNVLGSYRMRLLFSLHIFPVKPTILHSEWPYFYALILVKNRTFEVDRAIVSVVGNFSVAAFYNACNKARRGVGGGGVTIWLSPILIGSVNSVLLLPKIMELVGLGYFGWLVYQYLLFKDPVTWIELYYSISGDGLMTAFVKVPVITGSNGKKHSIQAQSRMVEHPTFNVTVSLDI
ncbi:integrase, catalytic region, zinc finger, CCHC-type containing protein [Tanacetum coccineum]